MLVMIGYVQCDALRH